MSQLTTLIDASPWGLVARWSIHSQEQARRNAMAACTVLAARRLERVEVEEFIAGYLAERAATEHAVPAAPVRNVS